MEYEIGDVAAIFDHPAHPYTRGLLASNPIASKRGSPLPSIPGTVPSPAQWPIGCHFADRCPFRAPRCVAQPISLATVADSAPHDARCVRLGEFDLAVEREALPQ